MKTLLNLRAILVITEKNIRLYYTKPPVLMFGLLFPLFMFFAFFVGRQLDLIVFFPAFLAMMLFFTSSSVPPLITPWEKRERTYERLLSFPVTQDSIIIGDIIAGAVFGTGITFLVWFLSSWFFAITITDMFLFMVTFVLGTVTFASLGALLASPAADSPPNVMIFSNLIRFPLIFTSGIFIPLGQMEGVGRIIAYCSPLTYLVDLFHASVTGTSLFLPVTDCVILIVVTIVFVLLTRAIQIRNMMRGI